MQILTGDFIFNLRRALLLSQEEFASLVVSHGGSATRVTVMRWEALHSTEIQPRPCNMRAIHAISRQLHTSPAPTTSQSSPLSLVDIIGVGA